MKRILVSLLFATSLFTACGRPEEEMNQTPAPALVSTSPQNGATGITALALEAVFTFDQIVQGTAEALKGVTVDNGASVDKVSTNGRNLLVQLTGLARGNSYTVTVPAGTVTGYKENQAASAAISLHFSMKDPNNGQEIPPEGWEKAADAVLGMRVGWNLGNTLDAHDPSWKGRSVTAFETGWGQPVTKPELLQMCSDAGFGAIRVPVTWNLHMAEDYTVDELWMSRVEEVVNYVLDAGMYCILNVHHDTGTDGWLRADASVYADTRERFISLWKQIAGRFNDYGTKLLFESFNEMLDANNQWNYPASAGSYDYINKYNQDFVTTVRSTGGNNRYRNLVVNDYCASSDAKAFEALAVPNDSVDDHLIAEFHSYSPYMFAMYEGSDAQQTWADWCEKEVADQIDAIAAIGRKKGIPVIIGEYGTTAQQPVRPEEDIAKQAVCYVRNCKKNNMACFYWMLLTDGEDRNVPQWTRPLVKDAIINAYYE